MKKTELMTIQEFMSKPLVEQSLKNKDKEYFRFIVYGDIFNGVEYDLKHYKKLSPPPLGASCKLYYQCKMCSVLKRYSDYHNLEKLRTQGRRICIECNHKKSLEHFLKMNSSL